MMSIGVFGTQIPRLYLYAAVVVVFVAILGGTWLWRRLSGDGLDEEIEAATRPASEANDATRANASAPALASGTVGDGDTDDESPETATDGGQLVDMPAPDMRTASFGIVQELWRFSREHRKRRKLVGKGYVQWYLIDGTFPTPKYVKPEAKGGGMLELEHDGVRYLFPREAMIPSQQQGMWTVFHRKGDADPINVQEPEKPSVPADELEEYLNLRVTSSPPSLWDKFDIDAKDAMMYLIGGIIVFAILRSQLGGMF